MSAREKEMSEILARADRQERFSAVMAYMKPSTSAILDLGCGIGALTSRLAERFPSARVVGFDRSKYLLRKVRRGCNIMIVLGDVMHLPFRAEAFDVVVAVQVLHEILHFIGTQALSSTVQNVCGILKKNGEFIIFDHANPGEAPVSLRLPQELPTKLHEFQSKFKPRKITFTELGEGRVTISLRDFYDFVTKIWALNSELEEEEMSETHTPFTKEELERIVLQGGLQPTRSERFTSINQYLEYYRIALEKVKKLPNRHIVLKARKKRTCFKP